MPKAAVKARKKRAAKNPVELPKKLTKAIRDLRKKKAELAELDKLPKAFTDMPVRADGTEEGVNVSQLNEFMRCPWRWHLRNRRQIDRRSIAPPMDLGSFVHAGISGAIHAYAANDGQSWNRGMYKEILTATAAGVREFRKTWIEEHLGDRDMSDELDDQLTELQVKGNELAVHAVEELNLERWEIISLNGEPLIEKKISIPFLPGVPFYGTPDVVWRDRDKGGDWVFDWKIRENMQAVENEEVDLQLPAYQYMLAKLGIRTVGAGKFQVRSRVPEQPSLNKNGTMSRVRIATTWEMYREALIAHGLKPDNYAEMKQKLDMEFFRLDQLYRNQFEIQSFWDNIIAPLGKQLVEAREFIRHMHFTNCRGCWAREFCLEELRGGDSGFLLETQYIDLKNPAPRQMLRPEDITFVMEGD